MYNLKPRTIKEKIEYLNRKLDLQFEEQKILIEKINIECNKWKGQK